MTRPRSYYQSGVVIVMTVLAYLLLWVAVLQGHQARDMATPKIFGVKERSEDKIAREIINGWHNHEDQKSLYNHLNNYSLKITNLVIETDSSPIFSQH